MPFIQWHPPRNVHRLSFPPLRTDSHTKDSMQTFCLSSVPLSLNIGPLSFSSSPRSSNNSSRSSSASLSQCSLSASCCKRHLFLWSYTAELDLLRKSGSYWWWIIRCCCSRRNQEEDGGVLLRVLGTAAVDLVLTPPVHRFITRMSWERRRLSCCSFAIDT